MVKIVCRTSDKSKAILIEKNVGYGEEEVE